MSAWKNREHGDRSFHFYDDFIATKAPSMRIRINLKTDKYLSISKFIRVHTLPFVNRFRCPHVNAKTIWKRWRRLLSMLFRAKHVPAVSRILSLNPLGCALGLLKLINSVRMAEIRDSMAATHAHRYQYEAENKPQCLKWDSLVPKLELVYSPCFH